MVLRACHSFDYAATNCMVGRVTASQIAPASTVSVLVQTPSVPSPSFLSELVAAKVQFQFRREFHPRTAGLTTCAAQRRFGGCDCKGMLRQRRSQTEWPQSPLLTVLAPRSKRRSFPNRTLVISAAKVPGEPIATDAAQYTIDRFRENPSLGSRLSDNQGDGLHGKTSPDVQAHRVMIAIPAASLRFPQAS